MNDLPVTHKKIVLCRHADAQWPTQNQPDFARKLSNAGLLQADQSKTWLLHNTTGKPQIVCSSAIRTLQTAQILAAVYTDVTPEKYDELYNATAEELLNFINNYPETGPFLMLVAHNPGVSNLAYELSGKDVSFGTGQVMLLDLPGEKWAEVSAGTAQITATFVPDEI